MPRTNLYQTTTVSNVKSEENHRDVRQPLRAHIYHQSLRLVFVFWLSPPCEYIDMINDLNMQHLSDDHMPTYSFDLDFFSCTDYVGERGLGNGQNWSLVSGAL